MKISGNTDRYQIPTFREVVNNATFVNGPPIPDPPQQLDLSSGRQLLLPFMNFTCDGTITRLTFFGWLNSESSESFNVTRLTSWPYFSLWHQFYEHRGYEKVCEIGPEHSDLLMGSMRLNHLVEVTLTTNVMINEGNILGVRLQSGSPISNGIDITVLKDSRGYGKTLVCDAYEQSTRVRCSTEFQEKLYISIETGET